MTKYFYISIILKSWLNFIRETKLKFRSGCHFFLSFTSHSKFFITIMSTSTVIIKEPTSLSNLHRVPKKSTNSCFKLFAICMWGLAAIITSAHTELSSNVTGIVF